MMHLTWCLEGMLVKLWRIYVMLDSVLFLVVLSTCYTALLIHQTLHLWVHSHLIWIQNLDLIRTGATCVDHAKSVHSVAYKSVMPIHTQPTMYPHDTGTYLTHALWV